MITGTTCKEEGRTANSGPAQRNEKLCDTCRQPLSYIAVYNAWYCYTCQKYGILPPEYQQFQVGAGAAAATSADSGAALAGKEGKCGACGGPLSSSGECNHCLAKEAYASAERAMEQAVRNGVEVRKAEQLLRQARNCLEDGNFGDARAHAAKTESLLKELEAQFVQAKEQIREAENVVGDFAKKQVDVGQSESLLQLAHSFLKMGNYEKAIAYSKKAIKTANEAQTRTVAERALEEKAPLPPAVAKPVEEGPAPVARPAVGIPAKCPSCGKNVEEGWKRCPSCAAPLTQLAQPAPPVGAVPRTPIRIVQDSGPLGAAPMPAAAAPVPAPPKSPEYMAAEKEIQEVEAELDVLEKQGVSVAHARNLLKLSMSFLRGGSYEKATRYARKARHVIQPKQTEAGPGELGRAG